MEDGSGGPALAPHAELPQLSGFCPLHLVIYNGCPRAFEAGIWWPQTKFGQPAAVPCPKGSVGKSHGPQHTGWAPGPVVPSMEVLGCSPRVLCPSWGWQAHKRGDGGARHGGGHRAIT